MEQVTAISAVSVKGRARADVLKAAMLALVFGFGLVYATGFAHPNVLHNAAHDSRHALGFPCH
ncbi:CbtB-domain containing protein [Stappia sp. F7233]|uniref:CbtB-domain containing protein n=1 Tax=Stappia albiluteola TaxID=2758565 RepID=A0A839AFL6_9HYPH|nr:CbtB domain-containing protein [Stappia albiluteola]MBA5778513.1 CbtB-domain containing protein [Stappia albiluteola]